MTSSMSFSILRVLLFALSLAILPTFTSGHLIMEDPPALGFRGNPNVAGSDHIDYNLMAPITGGEFPCKGHHKDPNKGAGKPVRNWERGSTQSFRLTGSATHGGGSCQASFSVDNGATWKVAKSFIGGCPLAMSYSFPVPHELPEGPVLFAWTWFNNIGNREMYMNCAVIDIKPSSSGVAAGTVPGRFATSPKYPPMFTANLGTGTCATVANKDVDFPAPGPGAVRSGTMLSPPRGECGPTIAGDVEGPAAPALPVEGTHSATPVTGDPSKNSNVLPVNPLPAPTTSTGTDPNVPQKTVTVTVTTGIQVPGPATTPQTQKFLPTKIQMEVEEGVATKTLYCYGEERHGILFTGMKNGTLPAITTMAGAAGGKGRREVKRPF